MGLYRVNVENLHEIIKSLTENIDPLNVYAKAGTTDRNNKEHLISFPESSKEANAKYIYNYLTSQGWAREAICGLLGNMEQESQLNPGMWEYWNNPKMGYGLVQWTPSEKYAPEKFLQENRLSVGEVNYLASRGNFSDMKSLMDMQLEYLLYELEHKGEWLPSMSYKYYDAVDLTNKTLKGISFQEYKTSTANAADLSLVFHASYERSDDDDPTLAPEYKNLNNRRKFAEKWEKYLN